MPNCKLTFRALTSPIHCLAQLLCVLNKDDQAVGRILSAFKFRSEELVRVSLFTLHNAGDAKERPRTRSRIIPITRLRLLEAVKSLRHSINYHCAAFQLIWR